MLIDLHYLPGIPFLALALKNGSCLLESQEHYQKRSFRNRAYIATANGRERLSIPLRKGKNAQMPIREVEISYDQNWQKQHWGAITAAYSKAPFFEFYAADLEILYQRKEKWLFDWNYAILDFLDAAWQLSINLQLTTSYQKMYPPEIQDLRGQLSLQNPPEIIQYYAETVRYTQVFQEKHGFIPNLSSLDLLFCTGPEGELLLRK
jgi:hypothetical protein